jgi:nuclear GTP-binding protein
LRKTERKHIYDVYGVRDWVDYEDFIKQVAERTGKLLKGGEPDINNVSKTIIMDWQRGNIPYFERPPKTEEEIETEQITALPPPLPTTQEDEEEKEAHASDDNDEEA